MAFVTNHGYLDNPTFRGMRQSLMHSFDDIYVLDLHGNSKKKEKADDGGKDENVFDIQQGVAIGIFVKHQKPVRPEPVAGHSTHGSTGSPRTECTVHHAHLHGKRDHKYAQLAEGDLTTTHWQTLQPQAPFYLFVPQDETLRAEYEAGWKITDIFPNTLLGPNSHRDNFAISFVEKLAKERIVDLANLNITDNELREKYELTDNRDWQLSKARKFDFNKIEPVKCIYRPFDFRWMLYGSYAFDYPRPEVNDHLIRANLALISTRQTKENFAVHATNLPAGQHKLATPYDGSYLSPLYLYSSSKADLFDDAVAGSRRPNLAPEFIADLSARLKLNFAPDSTVGANSFARLSEQSDKKCANLSHPQIDFFTPEDVFHYAYAVFHSPSYRRRYAEFLKIDFPRLPLTRDVTLFRRLANIGKTLVGLHLMEDAPPSHASGQGSLVRYPVAGDNVVEAVRYSEPSPPASSAPLAALSPQVGEGSLPTGEENLNGRVWINKTQYFDNVQPEVWHYHIGGYQVCQKWLKDRKGRQLGYDELKHYQGIIAALAHTIALQSEIDVAIGAFPLV